MNFDLRGCNEDLLNMSMVCVLIIGILIISMLITGEADSRRDDSAVRISAVRIRDSLAVRISARGIRVPQEYRSLLSRVSDEKFPPGELDRQLTFAGIRRNIFWC